MVIGMGCVGQVGGLSSFKCKKLIPYTHMHAYMNTSCLLPHSRKHQLHAQRTPLHLSLPLPASVFCLSVLDHQWQQSHETLGLVTGPQQVRAGPQRQRSAGQLPHGACNTRRGEIFQTRTPTKRPGPPGIWEVPLSLRWGWYRWERAQKTL